MYDDGIHLWYKTKASGVSNCIAFLQNNLTSHCWKSVMMKWACWLSWLAFFELQTMSIAEISADSISVCCISSMNLSHLESLPIKVNMAFKSRAASFSGAYIHEVNISTIHEIIWSQLLGQLKCRLSLSLIDTLLPSCWSTYSPMLSFYLCHNSGYKSFIFCRVYTVEINEQLVFIQYPLIYQGLRLHSKLLLIILHEFTSNIYLWNVQSYTVLGDIKKSFH